MKVFEVLRRFAFDYNHFFCEINKTGIFRLILVIKTENLVKILDVGYATPHFGGGKKQLLKKTIT